MLIGTQHMINLKLPHRDWFIVFAPVDALGDSMDDAENEDLEQDDEPEDLEAPEDEEGEEMAETEIEEDDPEVEPHEDWFANCE